jgi:hypothetical protein
MLRFPFGQGLKDASVGPADTECDMFDIRDPLRGSTPAKPEVHNRTFRFSWTAAVVALLLIVPAALLRDRYPIGISLSVDRKKLQS